MSRYRRADSGATFFFTVVAFQRRPILCDDMLLASLRRAIELVRKTQPFGIDAWVLMPDHMHCVWTLPEHDHDFSGRWMRMKDWVTRSCIPYHLDVRSNSSRRQRHSTIWQRRFWEHRIRDDVDFARHVDYIHFNPVKHGLVESAHEWPYSSIHRYVRDGVYDIRWAASTDIREMTFE